MIEDLRSRLVACWRSGGTLFIDCGKLAIDFSEFRASAVCPLETVFDFEKSHQHEFMHENFNLTALSEAESEAEACQLLRNTPSSDKWLKLKII